MLKHICIVFLAMCFCFSQTGQAKNYNQNVHLVTVSWYKQLGKTASGEMNNPHALTVAHKSLPFGTIVMFINPNNKKIVFARVTDRGPYIHNRI
jgi:rare lipoprotein A (peptidoglycan hydrolase)